MHITPVALTVPGPQPLEQGRPVDSAPRFEQGVAAAMLIVVQAGDGDQPRTGLVAGKLRGTPQPLTRPARTRRPAINIIRSGACGQLLVLREPGGEQFRQLRVVDPGRRRRGERAPKRR